MTEEEEEKQPIVEMSEFLTELKEQGFVVVEKQKLQELEKNILDYLNNYDVVAFLKLNQVKYDGWLKNQFFKLLAEIRAEIMAKLDLFGVESVKGGR